MRANLALSTFVAIALACTGARAADDVAAASVPPFGDRAANIVVIDHLAGFVHTARVYSDLGADASTNNVYGVMGVPPIVRIGYHRVVAAHVTVGLGVHYADQTTAIGQGNDQIKTWGVSPRVGWILPLHRMFAVWLRGGLTYLHSSTPGTTDLANPKNNTSDETESHVALGAEAQLVFTPAENVGFTLGPTIEWGFAGSLNTGSQNLQIRWRLYGVTAGLLVDF
jgi:hypothetical protein